jgi:hypothetical protein
MGTSNIDITEISATHRIILENCETGIVLEQKEAHEDYMQRAQESLQSIIKDTNSYEFVILHFTDEDYHTRILARRNFFVNGAKYQEVLYRATIYKLTKKKNRSCGLISLFRFFGIGVNNPEPQQPTEEVLPIVNDNSSNIYHIYDNNSSIYSGKYI